MKKAPFLLILPLLASLTATADPGRGPMGPGGRGGIGLLKRALATLDLSDQQKTQVRQIVESRKTTLQPMGEKARADRQKLETLLEAPNPDPAAVGTAFLAVHKNRSALKTERERVLADIGKVLTPEQKAQFDAILKFVRPRGARGGEGPAGRSFSR
jgi:Spy/CpxP family protein refolding chaperone